MSVPIFKGRHVTLQYEDHNYYDYKVLNNDLRWLKEIKNKLDQKTEFRNSYVNVLLAYDKSRHLWAKYNFLKNDFARKVHLIEIKLEKISSGLNKTDKFLAIISLGFTYPYLRKLNQKKIVRLTKRRSQLMANHVTINERIIPRVRDLVIRLEKIKNKYN